MRERCRLVRNGCGTKKQRLLTNLLGTKVAVDFGVHNNDVETLYRGVVERIFVSKYHRADGAKVRPPRISVARVEDAMRPFTRRLREIACRLTPMTVPQFVASRGRKRKVYEVAAEMYWRRGIQLRDSQVRTFVKAEKLNLTAKPDPDPRVIQPRSPVYNIGVGVYIAPLERVIYKHIATIFSQEHVVFKGLNAAKRGAAIHKLWSKYKNPVWIGFDVHRMDQHVNESLLQYEHSLYNLYYFCAKLARLLRHQLHTKGKGTCFDGFVEYIIHGCRMSGDMNTSLGNCLIMCALAYSYLVVMALTASVVNDGDDGGFICERDDLHRLDGFSAYLERVGLPVALERPVYVLEQIEFCQSRPVFNGTMWTMVRDPRVCLDKDSCSLKPIRTETEWNTIRNTVGMSGLALAGHMPIYGSFYEALRRGAGDRIDRDRTVTGFSMLAKGMNMRGVKVTDVARASFFMAFDISPAEQRAIEEHYDKLRPKFVHASLDGRVVPEGAVGPLVGCAC